MKHQIKRLKRHRNVLYSVVVTLLILQIVSFVAISSQTSRILSDQESIKKQIEKDMENVRQERQSSVDEIVRIIARQNELISEQRNDFEFKIDLLKSSQEDFSGIVEGVIDGVVSIRTDRSTGTGFVVDSRGYIVTNFHVISGARGLRVQMFDGSSYKAEIVGGDMLTDIALLKISGFFSHLDFANSEDVQIGEKVIAIGNPLGLSFTVTEGIVSATKRAGPTGLEAYIQTDVTLNPGNSGGPLINKEGKVVGINNFKIGGAESLGFALESDLIVKKINEIANQTIVEVG